MPPHKRKTEFTKLGVAVAVVVVIALTVMGKMHWVGAAITGLLVAARQLLPTAIRLFPMLASLRNRSTPGSGQSSTVETEILRMKLDHGSGALEGEVLKGQHQGWHLSELDKTQLQGLLEYCQRRDQDSAQLLANYLQQRFSTDHSFAQGQPGPATSSAMNNREALAVLGLNEGATEQEIIAAHRKLIQKIHPDRGGNDYLAAKINQAKDLLLG
jgi:hypothetical protein